MKPGHYSIREDQDDWLRNQAHADRTTKSALVRKAIDDLRKKRDPGIDLPQREGAGS